MKKCLGFAFCLWIMFSVPAVAASCAGGSGTVLTGKDGTSYCKSNISMNWWSAFAWCDAIGGRLIDVTEECIKTTGRSGCPNLTEVGGGLVWTQNVPSANLAYLVDLSSGAVSLSHLRLLQPLPSSSQYYHAALCVGF